MNMTTSQRFACPAHKTVLSVDYFCSECDIRYPTRNGIPILINDANSLFRVLDYMGPSTFGGASAYAGSMDHRTGLRQLYRRAMLRISESSPERDFGMQEALDAILASKPKAEILVIGSGDTTIAGNVTYTDVAFGANVQCIADAHDLPFLDKSFDACISVAVFEHVANPYRCVDEVMRVLRPNGFIYSETPFMQPVHMGAYDFTRFTHLGHRRLFRYFEEIRSGIVGGPGTSAGHLLRYALTSLSDRPNVKRWLKLAGLLIAFPFRWLDYLSRSSNSAYDSASGFYFFGSLCQQPITDRELLGHFRGG